MSVTVKVYVASGRHPGAQRHGFQPTMAKARDAAEDTFTYEGVVFHFDSHNTVYTALSLGEKLPAVFSTRLHVRSVVIHDPAASCPVGQVGTYKGEYFGYAGATAVVSTKDVTVIKVRGPHLTQATQFYNRIVNGRIQPTTPGETHSR